MQVELLLELKKEKNIKNKQIAEKTGLSESTISRILARQVEPKFEDVVRIAVVLGASLDDLAGIVRNEDEEIVKLRARVNELEADLRSKDAIILSHDREIGRMDKATDYLKRLVRILGTALAVVIIVVFVILAYDVLNGDIGWARYSAYFSSSDNSVLGMLTDWLGL